MRINELANFKGKKVVVRGWIKSNRGSNKLGFLNIVDGSNIEGVQIVYKKDILKNYDEVKAVRNFSSVMVEGELILTPKGKQKFEIDAKKIEVIQETDKDFPIQNKEQSLEFLRENYHLRARTTLFKSVFKIRSELMFLVEEFFNKNDFVKVSTPIITENDAEGAGETFTVTTLENNDYDNDFFRRKASLTVSGQLAAESFAQSMGKVYTFGPTFRAENSNTIRHIAEFWMLEPEIAFADKSDAMKNSEELLKYVSKNIFNKCSKELEYLDKYHSDIDLVKRIKDIYKEKNFPRISYKEAIEILSKNKSKFKENNISFGLDLGTEHEKFLAEEHFNSPVFIYDYPKDIKAFYMYLNDDNETVAGFDLLVPGVGELVGGSQRETRIDILRSRAEDVMIEEKSINWYFDLRRFGMAPSSGYGLGFERLVMFITGMSNIRDTIPFPRYPKNIKF